MLRHRFPRIALVALLGLMAPAAGIHASEPSGAEGLPHEVPDDPPDLIAPMIQGFSSAATIGFGRFTHIQVNVYAQGQNILRDAANEPSIVLDPTNPSRMAIGWRQFDSDNSNFRQAGFGYSSDGGVTWTAGKIQAGVFRSDPVLTTDAQGRFFYNSLDGNFSCQVFPSTDGGATWGSAVPAYGGDKQWMTIDRTASVGQGRHYEAWSTAGNPTPPHTFSRSVDGGGSYQSPSSIPGSPIWGTLDVGPDGTLYVAGTTGQNSPIYVARSLDAKSSLTAPTFTTTMLNLGGGVRVGGPNPVGLLGQVWVAVDRSTGPRSGWIYVLASVQTPNDPADVMFTRSTDGGQSWHGPVRINTDPMGNRAYQWFGTMSVAPNGRIDVVWNDSRGSADSTQNALYYASSNDGGFTWSPNEQASPVWDSTLGWPKQNKIGDYYHMVSNNDFAHLAWAATFNGEQDVYYTRIAPSTVAVPDEPNERVRLASSVPNPFSVSTAIRFTVADARDPVTLDVYDASGRRVAKLLDGALAAGPHTVRWSGVDDSGRAVKSGLYLCRLTAGGVSETLRLMLLR